MLYPTNIKKSNSTVRSLALTVLLFSAILKINPLNAQPKKNFSDIYVLGCLDKKALNYNEKATIQAEDKYGNLLCTYSSCEDTPSDGCLYENSFSDWSDFFGKEDSIVHQEKLFIRHGQILIFAPDSKLLPHGSRSKKIYHNRSFTLH